LASQYRSRKFYIVKVIDRDNEQDGVKFWRFKHNYKNEGILDKIIPIFRAKGDITDDEKGRDIILELTKAKANNGKQYTVIQTIMYDDPNPVHEDEKTAKEWLEDTLSWSDVYSKKPIEYLEAIANGEVPKWDSVTGKYVYGDSSVGEESFGGNNTQSINQDPQLNEEPSDDLPF
jgi:lipopolysaccharide export LptBFGC system permease protein LptF